MSPGLHVDEIREGRVADAIPVDHHLAPRGGAHLDATEALSRLSQPLFGVTPLRAGEGRRLAQVLLEELGRLQRVVRSQ